MSSSKNVQAGIGFWPALFLVFLVLRLCGVIAWSWWWVTAPLWGPAALAVLVVAAILVACGIAALVDLDGRVRW